MRKDFRNELFLKFGEAQVVSEIFEFQCSKKAMARKEFILDKTQRKLAYLEWQQKEYF